MLDTQFKATTSFLLVLVTNKKVANTVTCFLEV